MDDLTIIELYFDRSEQAIDEPTKGQLATISVWCLFSLGERTTAARQYHCRPHGRW